MGAEFPPNPIGKAWLGRVVCFGYSVLFLVIPVLFVMALFAAGAVMVNTIGQAFSGTNEGANLGVGALIAALLGAPFVIWGTVLKYQTVRYQKEGHITDRISKAVEQLVAEKTVRVRVQGLDGAESTAERTEANIEVCIGVLARCEWIERRENVIALGPSGAGKTHIALGLGLAACQKGMSVSFTTAAALVNELMEARDERRLLRVQKQMAAVKLLIIDELGFVPLSKTGAELLFEMISQRYERGATLITSNLPFDEWTETFGTERLTGALLDRLTHHVKILEMNGESYRLAQSRARKPGDNT